MTKKTLLQMVQNILSDMDSDEVNSITDTVESMQVAEIIRTVYEDLVGTLSIPERRTLIHLESLADITRPNYLKIPDNVRQVNWIRYNSLEVEYAVPETWITSILNDAEGDMEVSDFEGVTYNIRSNKAPKTWTSFDDKHIVFDSFDISVESTVQEVNSLAYVDITSVFELSDDYTVDVDDNLYPLILSEAKATAFVSLKQVTNTKEEQRARRNLVRVQNELNRATTGKPADRLPNYGRRR